MLSNVSPFRMTARSTHATTVPPTPAFPPCMSVPPITTAVTASSSIMTPAVGSAVLSRAVMIRALTPARNAESMYTDVLCRFTSTPRRRSAVSLPPSTCA